MQAFHPVAAGVTLSAEVLRSSRSLRKLTKGTKHARIKIVGLSKEMDLFADLYDELFRVCIFDSSTTTCTQSPVKRLVAWTEETIDAFRNLLDRIQDLVDISRDSVVDVLVARMKWRAIEREMECMRMSLSISRQGIKGFINIRVFEKLEEEEDMLRNTIERGDRQSLEERFGMTLEDRVRTVKHMRNNCRKQRHTIEHRLKKTKIDFLEEHEKKTRGSINVPEPQQLFQFTRSVEKYVDNVLPAKESGRRRRSRSKFDSGSQLSGSPTSLTPAALDGAARSTSSVSSARAETRSVPEDRIETSSGCTRCSSTCGHVAEHGKSNKSYANLTTLPDLTEVLGLAGPVGQRDFLAVPGRSHSATDHGREPYYGCGSSTQSSSSRDPRVSLEATPIKSQTKSDLHEATSSIASEDFETWWQTRGAPEPDAFTALEQKAQLVNGDVAYDDVSSEDEIESSRWRHPQSSNQSCRLHQRTSWSSLLVPR
ncbi:hypothetical protein HBI76_063020 [Parastagonospora nodorum]|nr:hypothetical protein HBI76_063020 [Parastagonospora nodorum]